MRPRTDTQTRVTTIHFTSSTIHAKCNSHNDNMANDVHLEKKCKIIQTKCHQSRQVHSFQMVCLYKTGYSELSNCGRLENFSDAETQAPQTRAQFIDSCHQFLSVGECVKTQTYKTSNTSAVIHTDTQSAHIARTASSDHVKGFITLCRQQLLASCKLSGRIAALHRCGPSLQSSVVCLLRS